ncbi:MAG TPA: Spy/CpxP family protein refolding chaperone [Pyrinomonadaceae bacterium]|nr:Spy/CpxP family protein refolding chaperone [Pyrinomonadaceae bacterium]
MKKIIFAAIALVTLSIGSVLVFAQRGGGEFGRGHGGRGGEFLFGRIAKELNLSDEQKTQIKQIMDAEKEKIKPIFESLKENRQKMQALTADRNFDEAKVKQLADEQGSLTSLLIVEKERTKSQIFQVLTVEQREKAKAMKEKFEERMKEGRKNRKDKPTDKPTE